LYCRWLPLVATRNHPSSWMSLITSRIFTRQRPASSHRRFRTACAQWEIVSHRQAGHRRPAAQPSDWPAQLMIRQRAWGIVGGNNEEKLSGCGYRKSV
jgi:hypothetical protein